MTFLPPETASTNPGSARPLSRPILLMTLTFFINFVTRSMIAPLLPLMEAELGLSHTRSGLLFFFFSLGGSISLLGSSFILSWIGYHRTITTGMLAMGLFVFAIGASSSWPAMVATFVLLGLSTGLYIPSALVIIQKIIPPAMLSRAMAVHEMAPNLGLISAPLLVQFMLGGLSWRGVLFVTAAACLVTAAGWSRFGQGGQFKAPRPNRANIAQALTRSEMWGLSALFSVGLAAEVGIYNLLPLFLVTERGLTLTQANYLVGLSRIPTLAAVLLAGYVSDRLGWRRTLAGGILVAGSALLLLALGPDWIMPPCVVFQALGSGIFWPPALSAMARAGSSETKAIVVSWATACSSVIGAGLVPAGIGALADLGSFSWGLTAAAILILSSLLLIPILEKR